MQRLSHQNLNKSILYCLIFCLSAVVISCNTASKQAEEGIRQLNAGNPLTALTYFEKALRSDPDCIPAIYGKARIMVGHPTTRSIGIEMMENILPKLSQADQRQSAYTVLAGAYADNSNFIKAAELLETALKNGLKSSMLFSNLAQYKMESGNLLDAKRYFEQGLEIYKDDEDLHYNFGLFLGSKYRDLKGAQAQLEKARDKNPERLDTLFNLVKIHYLQRNFPQALEILNRLLKETMPDERRNKLNDLIKQIQSRTWKVTI